MKFEFTPQLLILILTISVILLLITFSIWIGVYSRRTSKISHDIPVFNSNGVINIKDRTVTIIERNNNRLGEVVTYELDDFIYMLSINPDSKDFRELLKLINNKNTKKKIFEKLNVINPVFPIIIKFTERYRAFSYISVSKHDDAKNIKDINEIIFQIHNHPFIHKKKRINIEMDFLEESITPINDYEIYSNLVKTSKKFLSKGATVIKISSKYKFIDSSKDHAQNIIQVNILKKELAKNKVFSFLGRDGSLYAIAPNDRKKSHYSVWKSWNQKINTIFIRQRKIKYIDFDLDNYNIDTFIIQSRDSKSINEALIFVNLMSHYKRNSYLYNEDDLLEEAKSLNDIAEDLLKKLKDKKPPIRTIEYDIVGRGVKTINEVYIDLPKELLDQILKFSFRHKKDIVENLFDYANKEANKYKAKLTTLTLEMLHISEIRKYIESTKVRPNLYIVINERKRVKQFRDQLVVSAELLREHGIKTIQFITSEDGGNIDIYRIFKSEYILIGKGISESAIISDKIKINIKNIENIKEKETKIINIK